MKAVWNHLNDWKKFATWMQGDGAPAIAEYGWEKPVTIDFGSEGDYPEIL